MKDLIKILIWLFFILLVFIFQANHFFALRSVNPNLILLIIFLGVVLEKRIWDFLVLLFVIILLSVIFSPFWLKEILILAGLGFLIFLFKNFLTGNNFFDFLILIFLGTLGFYLIKNIHYFAANPLAIIGELVYNMALGILVMGFLRILKSEGRPGL